ncbi:entericidin A/B family lipoprotein [Candidatus Thiodictyon syntrophicum]|jgi:predicted small secreted protein|uniref:Entericidin n=1 Tax=Candidatus Thiodictyon syntrophicum TaxID=1166950 RepID=A0A2K8UAQ9_9GAMM|nr:entericidin A/B family lipoprotein [Candidatus Thiodictyon syntrophicum]AUB82151.1 entericidin [Candidatus Thiodictyon syntrophicum]
MNKLLMLMLLIAVGGLLGCNTMAGAGRDIQRGGQAVTNTANHVKSEM